MTAEVIDFEQRRIDRAVKRLAAHQKTFAANPYSCLWMWQKRKVEGGANTEKPEGDDDR